MTLWFPTILIAAILLLMETGRWFGVRRRRRNPEGSAGCGGVEAAVFGLMGLLIAFTFYGAESRFETRRGMIVEEANAIGAAYHRIDLLPSNTQPQLREEFRKSPLPAGDLSEDSGLGGGRRNERRDQAVDSPPKGNLEAGDRRNQTGGFDGAGTRRPRHRSNG
jgi:hypothetical protein